MTTLKAFSTLQYIYRRNRTSCFASRSFTTTAVRNRALAGSVNSHYAYILLHTHGPPSEYEAKPKSKVQRSLMLKATEWGGQVNFSWSPDQAVNSNYKGLPGGKEEEAYAATVFYTNQRSFEVPEVSLANLDEVAEQMRSRSLQSDADLEEKPKLHLYVCTHGARDCRCGETGGDVERALRREIEMRGISDQVKLGSVAHVGGHEFAANILVFPYGDWLGTVQVFDVPAILDEILERHASTQPQDAHWPPLCPPFWRGRMGLDKSQQLALISQ